MFYKKCAARKRKVMRAGGGSRNPTAHTAAAPTLGRTSLKQQRQIIAPPNGRVRRHLPYKNGS